MMHDALNAQLESCPNYFKKQACFTQSHYFCHQKYNTVAYYEYFKRRPAPRAAEGATRKSYGNTWWGKQWLEAFNQIDNANRLPRGKTYANKGLVQN